MQRAISLEFGVQHSDHAAHSHLQTIGQRTRYVDEQIVTESRSDRSSSLALSADRIRRDWKTSYTLGSLVWHVQPRGHARTSDEIVQVIESTLLIGIEEFTVQRKSSFRCDSSSMQLSTDTRIISDISARRVRCTASPRV